MCHVDNTADILRDQLKVTCLQCTNIDDHIDLSRAMVNGILRFEGLHFGRGRAEWETDHCANFNLRSLQKLRTETHPGGIHTYRSEIMFTRLKTKLCNFLLRGIRLKQRMVDHSG
jgi:hypothetical protein